MELEPFREVLVDKCGLTQERSLVVGFSGGPDSLCLLDSLARLGFQVIAAHFDHRLRPGSARDAELAGDMARRLDLPFVSEAGDVAGYAREAGLSVEEAARVLRYRFLFAQARKFSTQAVAVGHTADDQVETLLLHLLRGTGLAGLTGMRHRALLPEWDAEIPLVRPLLGYWRVEILACCQERGLNPILDPSNLETNFFRNRLRHQVIPFLEQYNPQARRGLWRTAQILSADAEVLQASAQQALEDCHPRFEEGAVGLRSNDFRALPVGLQRAVLRLAAARILQGLRDLDFAAVERGVDWVRNPGDGQIDLTRGLCLFVENGWIWVATEDGAVGGLADWPQMAVGRVDLLLPGQVEVAPGWVLSASEVSPGSFPERFAADASAWEAWLDAGALLGPLYLRRPTAGDRFQPLGMAGRSQKLSDFWINQKLPRRARAAWPLVVSGEEIVWVPGFRIAHPYRLRPETLHAVYLRLERVAE